MLDGLEGRTISVRPAIWGERDCFGNQRLSHGDEIEVPDVLVAPSTASAIEDGRPDGSRTTLSLYMADPGIALRGALIVINGKRYAVEGDPMPYSPELCPTRRNLVVEAVAEYG